MLDLHLAIYLQRRLNTDYTLDFLGRAWPITPTAKKNVTVVHHPGQRFWVIPHLPDPHKPVWPTVLGSFSL
jgi:hypothetical protein